VGARETISIGLSEFADLNGNRWEPLRMKIHHATVAANTAGQRAEGMLRFDR